jgi:hypothetical protein
MMIAAPNQRAAPKQNAVAASGKSLDMAIKRAKESGTLNLQSRELTVFPNEIIIF